MMTLRQHDPQATLPPSSAWQARIASMDESFRWAGIIGGQTIVAMMSGDEEKAVRLAKVAADLGIEGFKCSRGGWR